MPPRRRHYGFTLIELLIAVIVFGIVAAIAVPNYQNYIVESRVKAGAQALFTDLTYARSEAIKRNADVRIEPNGGDWQQGWVVLTQAQVSAGNDYGDCASDGSNCLSIQQPLANLAVTTTATATDVTYESDGRVASPVTFEVCDAGKSANITEREVSTSLTGRPSINYDGACS